MDFYNQPGVPLSQPLGPPDILDDFLADLRSNPTLNLDLSALPPDHVLTSGNHWCFFMFCAFSDMHGSDGPLG